MASKSSCDIYICRYNNYANREAIRPGKSIIATAVSEASYGLVDFMSGIDFNPGDGVSTTLVCDRANDKAADYVMVNDGSSSTRRGDLISSRWFILRSDRLRNGQYRLTLRRDLIADFYSSVKDSPIFVQKATLKPDDPLIFNDEGMSLNQIKQSQTPLADQTECGWIVGYIDPSAGKKGYEIPSTSVSFECDLRADDITAKWYHSFVGKDCAGLLKSYIGVELSVNFIGTRNEIWYVAEDGRYTCPSTLDEPSLSVSGRYGWLNYRQWVLDNYALTEGFDLYHPAQTNVSKDIYDRLVDMDGKIIYDGKTGKYYRYSLGLKGSSETYEHRLNHQAEAEAAYLAALIAAGKVSGTPDENSLWVRWVYASFSPYLTEVPGTTSITFDSIQLTADSYIPLNDFPYSMFCIPCPVDGHTMAISPPADSGYTFVKSAYTRSQAFAAASAFASALGGTEGYLYDIQYLPYCPISELRNGESYGGEKTLIWLRSESAKRDYVPIYFAYSARFEVSIPHAIDVGDPKISHCCDLYRLTSPNYSNSYDFDPAMNGGVSGFHAICTYKPYTPYICVHPIYGGLYGSDFDDARGLNLSGDYSVPVMTDSWTTYQIQNKNYANIFDRQLEYGEEMQKHARVSSAVNAVGSTVQGATAGAMVGGVAGAIAGGVMGAAGGVADAITDEAKYQATKQYQTDLYNYNLQNIQAKPAALVKSSSININNATWPLLEYFTCTDEERTALSEKLRYNGMTVMRIGTLSEFNEDDSYQWFQGQLIQCDGFPGDANVYAALSDEIAKGFHITK